MKIIKQTTYIVLLSFLSFMTSCSNDNNSDSQDPDNPDSETRISTYEIHISGGELDGQTFTGSFPNEIYHGGGGYIDQEYSNSSQNEVTLNASDTTDQGKLIGLNGTFILNSDGQALPIGAGLGDIGEKSTLLISLNAVDSFDPATNFSFVSKEGSISISDLEVGPNVGGTVYSDYNAEFEGTFRDVDRPEQDDLNITGELQIKSIRDSF